MLWLWKRVWEKRDDPAYDAATRLYRAILRMDGVLLTDASMAAAARRAGLSKATCDIAVERLLWCHAIKRKKYFGPGCSEYRLTGKPVTRTPLNGTVFRTHRRDDGTSWGPFKKA